MAGKLTISTLNNDTGVLATQNGMTGIAKAWVTFSGISPYTIASSFNVSSITFVSTGVYTISYTTTLADANYSLAGFAACNNPTTCWVGAIPSSTSADFTTTATKIQVSYGNTTPPAGSVIYRISLAIFGT
jgi:hypothetical protein